MGLQGKITFPTHGRLTISLLLNSPDNGNQEKEPCVQEPSCVFKFFHMGMGLLNSTNPDFDLKLARLQEQAGFLINF